jgi:hypothetical protein
MKHLLPILIILIQRAINAKKDIIYIIFGIIYNFTVLNVMKNALIVQIIAQIAQAVLTI